MDNDGSVIIEGMIDEVKEKLYGMDGMVRLVILIRGKKNMDRARHSLLAGYEVAITPLGKPDEVDTDVPDDGE